MQQKVVSFSRLNEIISLKQTRDLNRSSLQLLPRLLVTLVGLIKRETPLSNLATLAHLR